MYRHFQFYGSTKFTQIGIFGLKLYHLATLVLSFVSKQEFSFLAENSFWKKLFVSQIDDDIKSRVRDVINSSPR
jgi:hypothetical protein